MCKLYFSKACYINSNYILNLNLYLNRPVDNNSNGEIYADKERKFIVYEKQLLLLFLQCIFCSAGGCKAFIHCVIGTYVKIGQYCYKCKKTNYWSNSPMLGNVAATSLLLSSSIMLSGSLPSKVLNCLKVYGDCCIQV